MPLGAEVGLDPGDIVLDGNPVPKKGGHSRPHFFGHVYCGQTAEWIKMSLGTKVGLGSGHSMLDEDSASPKRATVPQFWAHVCCDQTVARLS